jgi:Tol biopolymer transport system component
MSTGAPLNAAGKSKSDVWHPLGPSDAHDPLPQFSSDGKWLAFSSNQGGTAEIYVTDFPTCSQRHRISIDGGRSPRWRSDGKELFYLSDDENMMAVPISIRGEPQIGKPYRLFAANLRAGSARARCTV